MITIAELERAMTNAGPRGIPVCKVADTALDVRYYVWDNGTDTWQVYRDAADTRPIGYLPPGRDSLIRKLTGRHANKDGPVFLAESDARHALRQQLTSRLAALERERARLQQALDLVHEQVLV